MECSLVQHQAGSLARWLECKQTIDSATAGSISMWLELALCLPPDHNRDMLNRDLEYLGVSESHSAASDATCQQQTNMVAPLHAALTRTSARTRGRERRWSESPRGTRACLRELEGARGLFGCLFVGGLREPHTLTRVLLLRLLQPLLVVLACCALPNGIAIPTTTR